MGEFRFFWFDINFKVFEINGLVLHICFRFWVGKNTWFSSVHKNMEQQNAKNDLEKLRHYLWMPTDLPL